MREGFGVGLNLQPLGMPAHMVFHERGDEGVTVVITLLQPQSQINACGLASVGQQLRAQLLGQKIVRITLIDDAGQHLSSSRLNLWNPVIQAAYEYRKQYAIWGDYIQPSYRCFAAIPIPVR